jgi:hypothetical protein
MLPPVHALRVQADALRGLIAKAHNDLPTALLAMQRAETAQAALPGNGPVDLAVIRVHLAGVLLAHGDVAAARDKLAASLPILDAALLPQAVELIEAKGYAAELANHEAVARH